MVGLRRPRIFPLALQNSEKTAPTWGGCLKYETHRGRCRPHRVFRKSHDRQNLSAWLHLGGFAPFTRISPWSSRIRRQRPLNGAGALNMRPPGSAADRIGLQEISKFRREPHGVSQGPSRRFCVVYKEFPPCARIRRKRPLLAAGVWNM